MIMTLHNNSLTADDYFKPLLVLSASQSPLSDRYAQLYFLLDQFARQLTDDCGHTFPNLFARLNHIVEQANGRAPSARELHSVRVHARQSLQNSPEKQGESLFQEDIGRMALTISEWLKCPLPDKLKPELPRSGHTTPIRQKEIIYRMRCTYLGRKAEVLNLLPHDTENPEPLFARITSHNSEPLFFQETIRHLQPQMQINLLQVRFIPEENLYEAGLLVVEPDFLMDISALSECFKEYGSHPLNYWISRLSLPVNSSPILLGNIANLFLDELLNETVEEPVTYRQAMQKAFRENPLAFAACPDLKEKEQEQKFFDNCKQQFKNLRATIATQFPMNSIDRTKAILEPAFICEPLGIQGRLDLLLSDLSAFVELKSGKAQEEYPSQKITHKENHYVQMMLYFAVLQFNLRTPHARTHAFLLYSRYPELLDMSHYWGLVKQALNLRNRIVILDFAIQKQNDPVFTRQITSSVRAEQLNEKKLNGRFWEIYLRQPIDRLAKKLATLNENEQHYINSLLTFICKEQYIAKCGGGDYQSQRGANILWSLSATEKIEAGEMICNMRLMANDFTSGEQRLAFTYTADNRHSIPNFRAGDMIMIYRRDDDRSDSGNSQVMKGSITAISSSEVSIALRIRQRNPEVLSPDHSYALERDYPDVGFTLMFRGIAAFLQATPHRKQLLLASRRPETETAPAGNDIPTIIDRAAAAKDYFLLMGPPGTGKTSQALRGMVERFYRQPETNILLIAYTNKAVDEICEALFQIKERPPFIRIGHEASCDPAYRPFLLKNRVHDCPDRTSVLSLLAQCRVYVATLTSLCSHLELFSVKQFDVALVDEASQILEPQLLPVLCAVTPGGNDAVKKFILIGDHKQLPAIVLQSEKESAVTDNALNEIQITNLRNSLFERLYRHEQAQSGSPFIAMLEKQGRMHPEISCFPARHFYNGRLSEIPLPHQTEPLEQPDDEQFWSRTFQSLRLGFIAVRTPNPSSSFKANPIEARYAARLATEAYRHTLRHNGRFFPDRHLGIITPYRNQIAAIRQALQETGIPALMQITIDTVERFQGSQRDIIIYSCCVNSPFQLPFIGNLCRDGEQLIDRKLNVALTRARKRLFLIGDPELLDRNEVYHKLLNHIRAHNGWVEPENPGRNE